MTFSSISRLPTSGEMVASGVVSLPIERTPAAREERVLIGEAEHGEPGAPLGALERDPVGADRERDRHRDLAVGVLQRDPGLRQLHRHRLALHQRAHPVVDEVGGDDVRLDGQFALPLEAVGDGREAREILAERGGEREGPPPLAEVDVASQRQRGAAGAVGELQLRDVDDAVGAALGAEREGEVTERVLGGDRLLDGADGEALFELDVRIEQVTEEGPLRLVGDPVDVDVVDSDVEVDRRDGEMTRQRAPRHRPAHLTVPGDLGSHHRGVPLGPVEVLHREVRASAELRGLQRLRRHGHRSVGRHRRHRAEERALCAEGDLELRQIEPFEPGHLRSQRRERGESAEVTVDLVVDRAPLRGEGEGTG